MKLKTLLSYVDDIKPNAFSELTKTAWVNECEGLVQTEVMLLSTDDVITYGKEDLDADRTLLVKPPHDKIYWVYLSAMVDFANGEYNKYQNTMQLFNAYFGEYMRWFAQTYRPADGEAINLGYYISAYAIAVNHGFEGTEEEWLENLKGETIEIRYSGEYDRIEYKYPSGTEWKELLKMSDLRGEAFQASVALAENAANLSAQYAGASEESAGLSKSWAVGGTGVRLGEDTDNARHYASQAAHSAAGASASAGAAQSSSQNAYQDALKAEAAKEAAERALASTGESANLSAQYAGASGESANLSAQYAGASGESARLSESWAVGGTGVRPDENANNAKYWAEQASQAAGGGVSSFNGRGGIVVSEAGDYTAAMVGAAEPGKAFTVVLPLAEWANNSQTVMNADISSSGYAYLIESSPDNYAEYRIAGVYADDIETDGRITFHCDKLPTKDLAANILKIEVKI